MRVNTVHPETRMISVRSCTHAVLDISPVCVGCCHGEREKTSQCEWCAGFLMRATGCCINLMDAAGAIVFVRAHAAYGILRPYERGTRTCCVFYNITCLSVCFRCLMQ